jgi:hypothetical protein
MLKMVMKPLASTDRLSRFLKERHRDYIDFARKTLYTDIFNVSYRGGFSVFCTTDCTEQEIWQIAFTHPVVLNALDLIGRFDAPCHAYTDAGLKIEKTPPDKDNKHYDVLGMPLKDMKNMQDKAKLKNAEQRLLEHIQLIFYRP